MFSKPLRVTACIVVSFFAWTFDGGATLVHAAQVNGRTAAADKVGERGPEERFSATLEEIEEALADPTVDLKVLRQQLRAKLMMTCPMKSGFRVGSDSHV